GATLPSFVTILLIAILFSSFKDSPVVIRIFKGIRPVVASLIAVPMINMAVKNNHTWWAWVIYAAALVAVAVLKFSPIYILLVLIVLAVVVTLFREHIGKEGQG
ncbi:MAG: chromate transporter, partial [Bacteroidales bacterium]|nr:chromate transporter [Bacteroidales bacterium]